MPCCGKSIDTKEELHPQRYMQRRDIIYILCWSEVKTPVLVCRKITTFLKLCRALSWVSIKNSMWAFTKGEDIWGCSRTGGLPQDEKVLISMYNQQQINHKTLQNSEFSVCNHCLETSETKQNQLRRNKNGRQFRKKIRYDFTGCMIIICPLNK